MSAFEALDRRADLRLMYGSSTCPYVAPACVFLHVHF